MNTNANAEYALVELYSSAMLIFKGVQQGSGLVWVFFSVGGRGHFLLCSGLVHSIIRASEVPVENCSGTDGCKKATPDVLP